MRQWTLSHRPVAFSVSGRLRTRRHVRRRKLSERPSPGGSLRRSRRRSFEFLWRCGLLRRRVLFAWTPECHLWLLSSSPLTGFNGTRLYAREEPGLMAAPGSIDGALPGLLSFALLASAIPSPCAAAASPPFRLWTQSRFSEWVRRVLSAPMVSRFPGWARCALRHPPSCECPGSASCTPGVGRGPGSHGSRTWRRRACSSRRDTSSERAVPRRNARPYPCASCTAQRPARRRAERAGAHEEARATTAACAAARADKLRTKKREKKRRFHSRLPCSPRGRSQPDMRNPGVCGLRPPLTLTPAAPPYPRITASLALWYSRCP